MNRKHKKINWYSHL